MHIMKSTFRMTTVRVLATLAVAVTFSGCAMKGDIRLLQEELRAIAARQDSLVAELRIEAQETQDTLRTQGDQMFDLRGDLNRQLQQINQSLVRIEAIAGQAGEREIEILCGTAGEPAAKLVRIGKRGRHGVILLNRARPMHGINSRRASNFVTTGRSSRTR